MMPWCNVTSNYEQKKTGDFLLWAFALVASTNIQRRRLQNLESLYHFRFGQNHVGCLIKYTNLTGLFFLETFSGGSMPVHHRQTHPVHSMTRANLNKSKKSLDFYYHSIKVHTQEAQNLYQLKSPLSDLAS